MGFRLGRTYVLDFGQGTYLEGAEIRLRSTPVGVTFQLEELTVSESIPLFLQFLESWNLEDSAGNPLPMTVEAIKGHIERPVLNEIMKQWYRAATGVSAPLDQPSVSGEKSPPSDDLELSIPMEPSSESRESLPAHNGS